MNIDLPGLVNALAVAAVVGAFRWAIKLRKDLNIAFARIRELEIKLK